MDTKDTYNRVPLKKGAMLKLKSVTGQEYHYEIMGVAGNNGSSCICYDARKSMTKYGDKHVILKEFYPVLQNGIVETDIVRNENTGSLSLNLENAILKECYDKFIDSIRLVGCFANNEKLKEYICADADVEPLETEVKDGTIYYENLFYGRSKYWIEDQKDHNVSLNEIIRTSIGVIDFLAYFHTENLAYVDLKPQDVLLTYNEMNQVIYSYPKFFDFDSVLTLGEDYYVKELKGTSGYYPNYFNRKKPNDQIRIDLETENHMFCSVLMQQVNGRFRIYDNQDTKKMKYNHLLKESIINQENQRGSMKLQEGEIKAALEEISTELEQEERIYHGDLYEHKKKQYSFLKTFSLFITMAVYGVLLLTVIKVNSKEVYNKLEQYSIGHIVLILFGISMCMAVFLTILRLVNSMAAERVSTLGVSCYYYDARDRKGNFIRDKNHSGFREKLTRKMKTFQDNGTINQIHQKIRLIMWIILTIGLSVSFIVAIYRYSLPLFFVLGLSILIVFLWSDHAASAALEVKRFADFYCHRYPKDFDLTDKQVCKVSIAKAVFYWREYVKTDGSFDMTHNFYEKNNRNLYTLRKKILEKCYRPEYMKIVNKFIPLHMMNYSKYMDTQEKYRIENSEYDLKFEPLLIRHIYKMAFDRIANLKLIFNVMVSVFTMIAVAMFIFSSTEWAFVLFKLPPLLSKSVSVFHAFLVIAVSVGQIFYASEEEKLIAEMSYKSRFISDGALNECLMKDIAAGYIKSVDIGRGFTQYSRYAISYVPGETDSTREERIIRYMKTPANMPLMHYRDITNLIRIHLTTLMGTGIVFSIVVWQYGFYAFLPILLVGAIIFDLALQKIIPIICKKKVIVTIEKYLYRKEGK